MRILLTNDDGIDAPGIRALADWASQIGDVTVSAPKVQQSGKSHAINIYTPFEIKKVDYPGVNDAYSVDSTPADCVRWGTLGLKREYDLILSGVNKGLNMGEDIMYSGTAGAVFEAMARGMKGIAFSTHVSSFDTAKEWFDRIYQFIIENKMLDCCDALNVNIPETVKGFRITTQGGPFWTDRFEQVEGDMWRQTGYCVHDDNRDLSIDSDATVDGYITITPLTLNRSNNVAHQILCERVGQNN